MIHVIRITDLGRFRCDCSKNLQGTGLLIGEPQSACYHGRMFNFGSPKTAGDWIVHVLGAALAIFLVWWMLRLYVL